MYSNSFYLLSGVSGISTGAAFPVGNLERFSIGIEATGASNLVSGVLNIEGRLMPSSSWINLYNSAYAFGPVTAFSGALFSIATPLDSIRAKATPTAGYFSVACRTDASKGF